MEIQQQQQQWKKRYAWIGGRDRRQPTSFEFQSEVISALVVMVNTQQVANEIGNISNGLKFDSLCGFEI